MTDIGPGDWVECIRSEQLIVGAIYQVEDIETEPGFCRCHGDSTFGLWVVGDNRFELPFCGLNFKPIYRPKADLIESLLNQAPPVFVGEPVTVER